MTVARDRGVFFVMSEPAPLDDLPTAGGSPRFPCDLVQAIVRGIHDLGPDVPPEDVGDEVRLHLDRLQRAWNAQGPSLTDLALRPAAAPGIVIRGTRTT